MLEVDAVENDNDIADKKRHKSNANGTGVNASRIKSNGNAIGRKDADTTADGSMLELGQYRFRKGQVLQVVHQFLESQGLEETSRMLRDESGMSGLDRADNRLSSALQELRGRNPRIEHAIELIAQFRRDSSGAVPNTNTKKNLLMIEFALLQELVLRLIFSGSDASTLEAAEILREQIYPRLLEECVQGVVRASTEQTLQAELEQRFALQLITTSRNDALELVSEVEWNALVATSSKQTLRNVQTALERLVKPDIATANRLLSLLANGSSKGEIKGTVLPRTVNLFAGVTDKEREDAKEAEASLLPSSNVQSFFCHADEVWCVEASSDGNMIASASKLGVIQLFVVDKDYLPALTPNNTNTNVNPASHVNRQLEAKRPVSNGTTNGNSNGKKLNVAKTSSQHSHNHNHNYNHNHNHSNSRNRSRSRSGSSSSRPNSGGKRKPKVDMDEAVGNGPLSLSLRLSDAAGHELFCLKFSPCDRFLVAGGADGMLYLWQVKSDHLDTNNASVKDKLLLKKQIHKGRSRVSSVCWCKPLTSGATQHFIATGFDCTCKLFNVKGEQLASISSDGIHDIKFYASIAGLSKQEFLVTASHRHHRIQKLTVTLPSHSGRKATLQIDTESMRVESPIAGTPEGDRYEGRLFASKVLSPMHSLLVDGKEHRVLVNVVDDWIYEYDARGAKLQHMYTQVLQDESILRPCFSDETKRYLICGSDDGNVYLWDRHESSLQVDPKRTLEGHSARVNAVCSTRTKTNHLVVVSASDDSTVRVWACGNGQDEQVFARAAGSRVKTLYQHRLAARARRIRLRSLRVRRDSGGSATSGRRSSGTHSRQQNSSYSREHHVSSEQGEENVVESDMTADEDNSLDEDDD